MQRILRQLLAVAAKATCISRRDISPVEASKLLSTAFMEANTQGQIFFASNNHAGKRYLPHDVYPVDGLYLINIPQNSSVNMHDIQSAMSVLFPIAHRNSTDYTHIERTYFEHFADKYKLSYLNRAFIFGNVEGPYSEVARLHRFLKTHDSSDLVMTAKKAEIHQKAVDTYAADMWKNL